MRYAISGKVIRNKRLKKLPATLQGLVNEFNKYSPNDVTSYTTHNWIYSRYQVTWFQSILISKCIFPSWK